MRKAEVLLEYQPLISGPPVTKEALYQQSAQNDQITINYWRNIWLGNATANKQQLKSFADHSVYQDFCKYEYGPVIMAGSGPSLKQNAIHLKDRGKIPLVSCLHNFHYFEDLGLAPEYYVSLDAGPVVLEEISEGGSKTPDEYWAMTKDRTLVAFIGSHPDLFKKWQGRILVYNAPIPDPELVKSIDELEKFHHCMSSGGNVLGAGLYFAKTILGCHQTIFIGADFSFSYENKFHSWDSKYDKDLGKYMVVKDVYGIPVKTWPTYHGFKSYFESVTLRIPGVYYNCSEGGCLGAYPEGNIASFKYMDLKDCLKQFNMHHELDDLAANPMFEPKKILYS